MQELPFPSKASAHAAAVMLAHSRQNASKCCQSAAVPNPWPGAVFVPVLDAPWDSSYLAYRTDHTTAGHPEVAVFRALALTLARELGPRVSAGGP